MSDVSNAPLDPQATAVLDFWFGKLLPSGLARPEISKRWWVKDPQFDASIREQFLALHEKLRDERTAQAWMQTPRSSLAYIVVFDQFSRNMFRDSANMYAYDELALTAVQTVIARKWDLTLPVAMRSFVYLPLMHAERLDEQEQCVNAFKQMRADCPEEAHAMLDNNIEYARQHRDIIARWGRFPHRNQIHERQSTPEELEFLQQPGSPV